MATIFLVNRGSSPNDPAAETLFSAFGNINSSLTNLNNGKLEISDIDDTPVNGVTNAPISSNWAYLHINNYNHANIHAPYSDAETAQSIGILINGATAKTTPVDADLFALADSEASSITKKLTWLNMKGNMKTYMDTFYGTITYNANSLNVVASDGFTGTVASLQTIGDSNVLRVEELNASSPAFDVRVTFTGVTDFNNIILRQYYHGGNNHTVVVQIYNKTTTLWDNIFEFTDQSGFIIESFSVPSVTDYIDSGSVIIRLAHTNSGIGSHYLELDYLALRKTPFLGGGGGVTDHNALTNIGTNSHTQIDSHINNSTIHFTQANITTVGTIGSGTWQGNAIGDSYISSASTWNSKQAGHANLTSLSGLNYAATSFVKMTGANTFTLDTNTYLTSFTESDPIYTASTWYSTTNNSSNWNTAYGWGNHAGLYDSLGAASSAVGTHESTYNHANYNTAYGWGNHASAGYALNSSLSNYLPLSGGTMSANANIVFGDTNHAIRQNGANNFFEFVEFGGDFRFIKKDAALETLLFNITSTAIVNYLPIQSTVTTGTAPFILASTTLITNLNADLLDGQHGSYYATAGHTHNINDLLPSQTGNTGKFLSTNGSVVSWEPIYPSAGIVVSNGSGWGTSKTAPTGDIVGTSDNQVLTNKSVNGVTLTTAGSATNFLNAQGNYVAAGINITVQTLTFNSTNTTMDYNSGSVGKLTLIGNVTTITISNLSDGREGVIEVTQDGTGYYGINTITHSGLTTLYQDDLRPVSGNINSLPNTKSLITFLRVGTYLYISFGRYT